MSDKLARPYRTIGKLQAVSSTGLFMASVVGTTNLLRKRMELIAVNTIG